MPVKDPPLPVLLLAFNRPEHVRAQISRLEAAPIGLRLYVAIDGPRPDRPDDTEAALECLRLVRDSSLYSDKRALIRSANLGCGRAVSEAISWFFSCEASGAILEDDCIPHDEFWGFIEESLNRYRDCPSVGHISGTNFVPGEFISNHGARARLSRYPNAWGWATWRDRWSGYQLRQQATPVLPRLTDMSPLERAYWRWAFNSSFSGIIDTWDYQWIAHNWLRGRVSLTTNLNVVSNVGWQYGAHSTGRHVPPKPESLEVVDFARLPLCASGKVDSKADKWEVGNRFNVTVLSTARRCARSLAGSVVRRSANSPARRR